MQEVRLTLEGNEGPESLESAWSWWQQQRQRAGFRQCMRSAVGCSGATQPQGIKAGQMCRTQLYPSVSGCSLASQDPWLPSNLGRNVHSDKQVWILYCKPIAKHQFEWAILLQKYSLKITEVYLLVLWEAQAVWQCMVPQALHLLNAFPVTAAQTSSCLATAG